MAKDAPELSAYMSLRDATLARLAIRDGAPRGGLDGPAGPHAALARGVRESCA
jgi:hypothetical protein